MGLSFSKVNQESKVNSGVFGKIPYDIFERVCKMLSTKDVKSLGQTCSYVRSVVKSSEVKYPMIVTNERSQCQTFDQIDILKDIKDLSNFDIDTLRRTLLTETHQDFCEAIETDENLQQLVEALNRVMMKKKRIVIICCDLLYLPNLGYQVFKLLDYIAMKAN